MYLSKKKETLNMCAAKKVCESILDVSGMVRICLSLRVYFKFTFVCVFEREVVSYFLFSLWIVRKKENILGE